MLKRAKRSLHPRIAVPLFRRDERVLISAKWDPALHLRPEFAKHIGYSAPTEMDCATVKFALPRVETVGIPGVCNHRRNVGSREIAEDRHLCARIGSGDYNTFPGVTGTPPKTRAFATGRISGQYRMQRRWRAGPSFERLSVPSATRNVERSPPYRFAIRPDDPAIDRCPRP